MKDVKKFRERLKLDLDFKKKFEEIKSADEAIKLAAENGYDLTNCSKQEEKQLTEDMLENVAGGIDKITKCGEVSTITTGDGSSSIHDEPIVM